MGNNLTKIVGGSSLLLILLYANSKRKQLWTHAFNKPSVTPILGHLDRFQAGPEGTLWMLKNSMELKTNWILYLSEFIPAVVICRPEEMQQIMKYDTPKGDAYDLIVNWLGVGLLNNTGSDWKMKRRMLTPSFHFEILKEWCKIMTSKTSDMLEVWDKFEKNDETVDIQMESTLVSLDIIGRTAMGVDFDCLTNRKNNEFVAATLAASRLFLDRFVNPILQNDFIYSLTAKGKENERILKILHTKSLEAISKRSKELEMGAEQRQKYFMDILLTSTKDDGSKLTFEEQRAETDTFMFEGHDTTSCGIMWVLYDIATNEGVQEKVFNEIAEAFGSEYIDDLTFQPSYEDLNSNSKLKYFNKVILESNRLHPPVPGVSRRAVENTVINGVNIPAGTEIFIQIYSLHMQSDIWPDPTRFDPSRFDDDKKAGRNPFHYLPFSAGPRNCIGQNFALLEMKAVVSMIIFHFELTFIGPDPKPDSQMVLRNGGPLNFKLKRRVSN